MDVQDEIELLQIEIQKANAVIAEALRRRKAVAKDSTLAGECNAAVVAAREALAKVEIKLRALYESKED